MEIANIVCEDKIDVGPGFNVVNNMEDIIFKELPTLIIGLEIVRGYFNEDSINPLNKKINKNTFWTFKRTTMRNIYNEDLDNFIRYSYKTYIEKINFVDVDLIQHNTPKLKRIIKKMLSYDKYISYKTYNDVIYLYIDNLIFGIDLKLVEFIGFDVKKIEDKIKKRSTTFLEGEEIMVEYNNQLDRVDNDIKMLPFFYSLNISN